VQSQLEHVQLGQMVSSEVAGSLAGKDGNASTGQLEEELDSLLDTACNRSSLLKKRLEAMSQSCMRWFLAGDKGMNNTITCLSG
jgi:hypothetical protein